MLQKKSWLRSIKYWNKKSILFSTLVVVLVLSTTRVFKVSTINCSFNGTECPNEVTVSLNSLLGKNALSLNQKKIFESVNRIRQIEDLSLHFKIFNRLEVEIKSNASNLFVDIHLISNYPSLSLNSVPESSTSAVFFIKPSEELSNLANGLKTDTFSLWPDGSLTPVATSESKIILLMTKKPDSIVVKQIYEAVNLLSKYLSYDKIYIADYDIFLSRLDLPDIIMSVPYDERSILEALQSLGYLSTIKKDNKVIDLRYKNPVIR